MAEEFVIVGRLQRRAEGRRMDGGAIDGAIDGAIGKRDRLAVPIQNHEGISIRHRGEIAAVEAKRAAETVWNGIVRAILNIGVIAIGMVLLGSSACKNCSQSTIAD